MVLSKQQNKLMETDPEEAQTSGLQKTFLKLS